MLKKIWFVIDDKFEEVVVVILCCTLVLSLTYTVIVRYAFHTPLLSMISHWAEELASFAFVWLLYFGAIVATKKGAHFRIMAQFNLLPEKYQKYALLPGNLVWLIFNLIIIKLGWDLANFSPEESLALEIPMKFVYFIIPLSFSLISIRLIQHTYRSIRSDTTQQETDDA